jgi:amino acid adenylation domain-containing protein
MNTSTSLVEWTHTLGDSPKEKCVHDLFEAQVERTPNAIAVAFEDQHLTYRELNRRANQLAQHLQELGVGPEVLVGICVQRSLEMAVGILGILKAGGAYLPLDSTYPRDRIAFMLKDARAPILLTQASLVSILPDRKAKVVFLDTDWPSISRQNKSNTESDVVPTNLAYVIYTSGSTGQPKGVMVSHANLFRYVDAMGDALGVASDDTYLHTATVAFSSSVRQLFLPLASGARVMIAAPDKIKNPIPLFELIKREEVTVIDIVPSYLRSCTYTLAGLDPAARKSLLNNHLRLILTASETLPPELAKKWMFEMQHPAQLINMYGQTETTGIVSVYSIPRRNDGAISIGRAIDNTQIYILDQQQRSVPDGMLGEIYVGGADIARGYLNRPDLTAERFVPDPFSEEAGSRLYRTGDLARYLQEGSIGFAGRMDQQVKIRGFRVELGEIEAALHQHEALRDAVVANREETSGETRLVAYIVPHAGEKPDVVDLREFLSRRLPEYMLPSAFVLMESLPLTPTGKVDRRALPASDHGRPDLKETFVAPSTHVEELLAGIWTEVLKLEKVGIYDNFFELGGHSLLATRVISRTRSTFQVELPLQDVFEAPTVAGLAERVEAALRVEQDLQAVPPLLPVSRGRDLPLSFAQQRLWFLDQWEPGNSAYNMPAAFRLTGPLDVKALECSLNEIVRRHESLRTSFSVVDGQPIQVMAPSLTLTLPVVDLQELPEDEREDQPRRLATEEAKNPFDLAQGPLLRSTLLRLGAQDHVLLLNMHHIVSDGWSMGVFFRELSALYEAFSTGKSSPLPELPIQYADFAGWQRQWLQGQMLETQLSYWRQQLETAPPVLELPTDHPRPPVQTYRGARQSLVLSKTLTEALKALSRQESSTLFMTLLAAFQILLHRYTGQDDIVVGTPVAGRNRTETEGLIGFFLNSLVLRTDLSGNPTFRELLARVRQVALGAYTHQDLPFEKLLEELQAERDLSRTPLFQIFFNMINSEDIGTLTLREVTAEQLDFHEPTSKFDLTLYAGDRNGTLWFSLVYNPDLFEPATISGLLGHYHTLLEAIAAHPHRPISSLKLLTEAERNQLSTQRNRVAPTNPFIKFEKEDIEQSIPARFEQLVKAYPHRIAVKTRNYQWTYSDLNHRANQIAQTILQSSGRKEERIALLFEHDAPIIAGVLGVLKAGKTYVPLDPTYPKERLSYILKDSQARTVITNSRNIAAPALTNGTLQLINIDDARPVWIDNPTLPISPDTLAYILYTSGSTGQPKGVMQNHHNVLHHVGKYTNSLHLNSDDRLTLLSSYSFDAAIMDMFGALLNGATLCPMDLKEEDRAALLVRMVVEKITIYHSTPTVFRYLFGSLTGKENFSTIRFVVLGGEEAQKKDVDLFKRYFPSKSMFVNGLGPTESTLALQYFISHETRITRNTVPAGYPVEDTEILLLNEAGEQAEIYGEIGISSAHVALGYWRKPELTKAAFLPDPEGGTKRIYRTGDLGRLLPDGTISFIGRKDDQVKIRGYRVEPGEVKSALLAHPAVRESAVMAREDAAGNKYLVGYIVPNRLPRPSDSELRAFLKERLPDYMVPSALTILEELPLTPNGKVDRRALPAPDQIRPDLKDTFVAPRTPAENLLAQIWAEVLTLDRVGIYDSFFDLGGHSLLATQVVSRIRNTFHVELALRALFENPTVAGLAAQIAQIQTENSAPAISSILADLESLSEEEAEHLVGEQHPKNT